jgi:hypothetical protein
MKLDLDDRDPDDRKRDQPLATLVTQGKLAATQRVLAIVKF